MAISAGDIRTLHRYEIQILHILERSMQRYKWVPLDHIRQATGLSDSEVAFRIGRLMEKGLIRFEPLPYEGYGLVFAGYDALALLALVKKGTVRALGCQIGEGKESVIYEALGLGSVALKFHHVGQRSFRTARQKREYLPGEGHYPWIFASRSSAEREIDALRRLHPAVRVPLPIDINRHVVVMEALRGLTLNRCVLEEPEAILADILREIRGAFRLGVIHSDLSEFNVMISDGECVLIDWPQWAGADHANARELLERDVRNILIYFHRKYQLPYDLEEAIGCVTG
jgi:RIO kinase 2